LLPDARFSSWVASLGGAWEDVRQNAVAPVAVAVLDSGVDGSHPDLAGRIAGAVVVEFENGKPILQEKCPSDNNDGFGHGTAVAGIIAAIAPNARIYDVRVLGGKPDCAAEILLAGFEHALGQPWRLINMSLAAASKLRPRLIELCERAYFQEQIVVAARRNLSLDDDGLPASLSSCIGVDRGRYDSPFDYIFRRRTPVEFEARGEDVVVPARGGGYTTLTGTSIATPTVCALCALLLGAYPERTSFELKTALRDLANSSDSGVGKR
jgi:subtilisin family serine protease